MSSAFSRREFLKLSGLTLGGLALSPRVLGHSVKPPEATGLVRVASGRGIDIYNEPQYPRYNDAVKVVANRQRDQLLYVYEKFQPDTGPEFNPNWYRVDEGYAHTAYLQPVQTIMNEVVPFVREDGELFEVTVPLTQSYQLTKSEGWRKLYRLYYKSTHWVTGVETGPDGAPWYRIEDELLYIEYYVLASHLRKIPASELTPVSTRVRPEDKRVEVSIAEQRLLAYEEDAVVMDTKVSTGIPELAAPNDIPTATPKGSWVVFSKMPVRHMGDGRVTSDINAYELPGVPWVSYFHEWGVAFHGTYWHDNFGNEMSHGCVNMRPDEAKWLFRWLLPSAEYGKVQTTGTGTRVVVI
ncbi:MAG: L,D-transpeptidase [Anaerolineales bacterium]